MARIELAPDPELTALWPGSSGAAIVVTTRSGQCNNLADFVEQLTI